MPRPAATVLARNTLPVILWTPRTAKGLRHVSPSDSVLGGNLFLCLSNHLQFTVNFSSPCLSWSSTSFPSPGVPVECCSGDNIIWRFSHDVSNPFLAKVEHVLHYLWAKIWNMEDLVINLSGKEQLKKQIIYSFLYFDYSHSSHGLFVCTET